MADEDTTTTTTTTTTSTYSSRQAAVFTNWINAKIKCRNLRVEDIYEDLKNGVVLYNLLEELAHQSLAPLGKLTSGATQIHRNVNMSIVFRYLTQTIKMVGIGPADIVEGNPSLTLGLIWSIIVFFSVKDIGDVVDLKAFKAKVFNWVQRMTEPYSDVSVTNFTSSFADGHALNAILNRVAPSQFEYSHLPTAAENLERAFNFANNTFGVAQLLDPNDTNCCDDEKSMLTYLAEMMTKLPPPPEEPSTDLTEPSPPAEPLIDILDVVNDTAGEMFELHVSDEPEISTDEVIDEVRVPASIPSDEAQPPSSFAENDELLTEEKGLPEMETVFQDIETEPEPTEDVPDICTSAQDEEDQFEEQLELNDLNEVEDSPNVEIVEEAEEYYEEQEDPLQDFAERVVESDAVAITPNTESASVQPSNVNRRREIPAPVKVSRRSLIPPPRTRKPAAPRVSVIVRSTFASRAAQVKKLPVAVPKQRGLQPKGSKPKGGSRNPGARESMGESRTGVARLTAESKQLKSPLSKHKHSQSFSSVMSSVTNAT